MLGGAAADGGGGVGADRRRARRAQPGAADAQKRLPAAALGHARRRARAGDPEDPPRQLLPVVPRAAAALGAGAGVGGPAGVRVRRLDAEGRPAGRVARAARLAERGLADLCRPRRAGRGLPHAAARGPLPVPVARRQGREGPRRRPRRPQVPGDRARRARVRTARGDRPRLRRVRDRGLLARLPPLAGQARPRRRAAGRLRRARRPQERDRPGARLRPGSAARSTSCARRSATPAASSSRCSPR